MRGRAELGGATTGTVRWEIAPVPGGSQVSFSALVEQASLFDRLLLLAGGRWWLGRIVRAAVDRLGAVLDDAQPPVNG